MVKQKEDGVFLFSLTLTYFDFDDEKHFLLFLLHLLITHKEVNQLLFFNQKSTHNLLADSFVAQDT